MGYWDIALMSISGANGNRSRIFVSEVSLTRFGRLGFGPYEIGILGSYGSPDWDIWDTGTPPLTHPFFYIVCHIKTMPWIRAPMLSDRA